MQAMPMPSGQGAGPGQSMIDVETRTTMTNQIYHIFQSRKPGNQQYTARLPDFVKRLEDALFKSAKSKEEYCDLNTLESRLHDVARKFVHPRQSGSGASSQPGAQGVPAGPGQGQQQQQQPQQQHGMPGGSMPPGMMPNGFNSQPAQGGMGPGTFGMQGQFGQQGPGMGMMPTPQDMMPGMMPNPGAGANPFPGPNNAPMGAGPNGMGNGAPPLMRGQGGRDWSMGNSQPMMGNMPGPNGMGQGKPPMMPGNGMVPNGPPPQSQNFPSTSNAMVPMGNPMGGMMPNPMGGMPGFGMNGMGGMGVPNGMAPNPMMGNPMMNPMNNMGNKGMQQGPGGHKSA